MKKNLFALAAAVILLSAALTGCLSTSSGSSSSSSAKKSSVSVKLYHNVPSGNTYAAAAVLAIKVADSSYTGVCNYQYVSTPTDVTPVLKYYAQCESVRAAIATGQGKCTLAFNTKADGSGANLVFSESPSAVIKTLLTMAVNNYTSVYALYRF